jgi:UDP-2,3-diacylglucosamine hydrolase
VASSLFISDLHLSEERPEANEAFFSFIEDKASQAAALYILGDLFEYWIGDDDLGEPFNAVVAGFLRNLSRGGVELYVMHGNRDFLMGEQFCEATGARLLEDPSTVTVGGERTILMHGDTLCADDTDYQAWRLVARSRKWQDEFLARTLEERRHIIIGLREKSQQVISAKPAEIMDVSDAAVRNAFERLGARRMVHGHTHRPGHHRVELGSQPAERWVLPDWYGPGGYLEIPERGSPRLVNFQ